MTSIANALLAAGKISPQEAASAEMESANKWKKGWPKTKQKKAKIPLKVRQFLSKIFDEPQEDPGRRVSAAEDYLDIVHLTARR